MTVYAPVSKLSWKVTAPILVIFAGLLAFVWLGPLPPPVSIPAPIFKGLATFSLSWLSLMLVIWTIWGDYD